MLLVAAGCAEGRLGLTPVLTLPCAHGHADGAIVVCVIFCLNPPAGAGAIGTEKINGAGMLFEAAEEAVEKPKLTDGVVARGRADDEEDEASEKPKVTDGAVARGRADDEDDDEDPVMTSVRAAPGAATVGVGAGVGALQASESARAGVGVVAAVVTTHETPTPFAVPPPGSVLQGLVNPSK